MKIFHFAEFSYLSIISRSLQIVFQVHFHVRRQQVIHHDQANVLAVALETVESEELGQKRSRILAQIQIIPRQELLKELAFFVLNSFDDELIVAG